MYVKKSQVDYYPFRLPISEFTVLESQTSKKIDKTFFFSNATTCPLWTSWPLLPVVAKV
jgi:hypothetical protein